MKSRYDLMEKSNQRASDGTFYPDVMSFKIKNFRFTETPIEYYLNEIDIKRKDILIFQFYNKAEYDDIVLWLNKISNIRNTNIGDQVYIPSKKNMEDFYLNNRV